LQLFEARREREQPFLRDIPPEERDIDPWEGHPNDAKLRLVPVLPALRRRLAVAKIDGDSAEVSARSEVDDRTEDQAINLGPREEPGEETHLVLIDRDTGEPDTDLVFSRRTPPARALVGLATVHAKSTIRIGDRIEIFEADLSNLMMFARRSHPAQHRVALPMLGRQDEDRESRDVEVEVLLPSRPLTPPVLGRVLRPARGRRTARPTERVHARPAVRIG